MVQGAANPFYIQPATADFSPLLSGIGSFVKESREERKRQESQAEVREAVQSGDAMRISDVMIKYPEYSEAAKNAFGFTNKESEAVARESYRRALTDPDNAAEYIKQGIDQVTQKRGRPEMMTRDLQGLQSPDESVRAATLRAMEGGYASIDPKGHKALFGEQRDQFKQQEFDLKKESLSLRKTESELRQQELKLRREDNQGKRDKIQLDIEAKKGKIQQEKDAIKAASISAIDSLDRTIDTIDRLLTHPGLEAAVGTTSVLPSIPGTERADFEAELESFDAKLFSTAIAQMKGMGSLSDAEGRKISAAVGAINPKMTEKAFRRSLNTIKEGFELAKFRSKSQLPKADLPAGTTPPPTNTKGWGLMTDAQGNKAYVGPNGEIEEVR